MKIAVCDDELTVREQVSDIIKTYFDERKRNAELTLYESGSKMIEDKEAYDIIFLDIEMPEINGIDLQVETHIYLPLCLAPSLE